MALWDTEMEDVLQIFEVLLLSCAITNIKAVLCHSEGNSGKKKTTLCACVPNADSSCDLLYSL